MADDIPDWLRQPGYRLRFGWGPNGLRQLAPLSDIVVIVDVLSFSTSVDVALGRGAVILPYRWHDGSEQTYGADNDAIVASRSPGPGVVSLRPSSLTDVPSGTRLVLPSPNGSALAFAAREAGADQVIVGSLRNASAVGAVVAEAETVSVIAAGERWRGSTGPLRPAIEDLIGAGAILSAAFGGATGDATEAAPISPEARTAVAAFADARPHLAERLETSGSGRELIERGFAADVALAADLDCSTVVPTLDGNQLVDPG